MKLAQNLHTDSAHDDGADISVKIVQQKAFAFVEKLNESYVGVWEDICNIESPSEYKKGVDLVGEYFICLAKEKGWQIEVFEQSQFGNVVTITMNSMTKKPPVTLSGHIDTVHPIGAFGTPPVRRDGERLYGPGTMDCKGGVAAGFLAMEALQAAGYNARPVRMILQSNEEIGSRITSKATINYMCEKAKGSVAFLNLEGYEEYFSGRACLIRKGIAGFLFIVKGIEAHSSYCADEGANAIAEAVHKIIEIEKFKDSNGITCSCNIIGGGTAVNTVSGSCEFCVDARFSTNEQYEEICKQLQKIANTVYVSGCSCEMVQTNTRCAMELNEKNLELLKTTNEILIKSGLEPLEIGKRNGGSDAADISSFGIPSLDSMGVCGGRAHSPDEYGVIDSLKISAKRIVAIVSGI